MGNCAKTIHEVERVNLEVEEKLNRNSSFREHRCNFTNYHYSINVGGRVHTVFHPQNNCLSRKWESDQHYQEEDFMGGLKQLIECIKEAHNRNQQIRAVGSGWSLSNIAYVNGVMVDCVGNFNIRDEDDRDFSKGLNYCKVGVDDVSLVADDYKSSAGSLCFVQSGVQIKYLNEALAHKGFVLKTQGASDGQTFVGAVSTGTHGSALQVGSIQDCVKGIHLVLLRKHVYIQRASDKVVTKNFCKWLNGADFIESDHMFNAALVSFGSFGLIHGLLLETEKSFNLKFKSCQKDYDEVKDILSSLDVAKLGMADEDGSIPFHFEVAINPYRRNSGEGGAFIRTLQKVPRRTHQKVPRRTHQKVPPESKVSDPSPENDSNDGWTETHGLSIMGILNYFLSKYKDHLNDGVKSYDLIINSRFLRKMSDIFSKEKKRFPGGEASLYGYILQEVLYKQFKIDTKTWPRDKPPNKTFKSGASTKRYDGQGMFLPCTSIEVCVPSSLATKAAEKLLNLFEQYPIGALLAFRYVKKSQATLAHTHFDNAFSTTIEICGAWTNWYPFNNTGEIHEKIYKALDEFSPSYHWGQQQPKGSKWLKKSYGANTIKNWIKQREKLLTRRERWMFSNDTIVDRGLCDGSWRPHKEVERVEISDRKINNLPEITRH